MNVYLVASVFVVVALPTVVLAEVSDREAVEIARKIVHEYHPAFSEDVVRIEKGFGAESRFRLHFGNQEAVRVTLTSGGELTGYEDYSLKRPLPPDKEVVRTAEGPWKVIEVHLERLGLPINLPHRKIEQIGGSLYQFELSADSREDYIDGVRVIAVWSSLDALQVHAVYVGRDVAHLRLAQDVRGLEKSVGLVDLVLVVGASVASLMFIWLIVFCWRKKKRLRSCG